MAEQTILEGIVSVEAALEAKSRELLRIYIRHNRLDSATFRLEQLAGEAGVTVERVNNETIEAHATSKSHGGIIAFAAPREYLVLDDLLSQPSLPFIVLLDGIEDPFNFGYAVRALYAAGVNGLVVGSRDWLSMANVAARASAGASERIATAVADSPLEAAVFFKGKGLTIACAVEENATPIYSADLAVPLFMAIGGEKRGVNHALIDEADLLLRVPYGRSFDHSLGAACAAAVLAFEVMRQRQMKEQDGITING